MLFSHMGFWSAAIVIVLLFFAKNYFVNLILNSQWAETYTRTKGWAGLLNITSSLHAILTFLILFIFAGLWWSLIVAIAVGVMEYGFGYWESKHRLPTVTTAKLLEALSFISTLKSFSYTGILASVLQFAISAKLKL